MTTKDILRITAAAAMAAALLGCNKNEPENPDGPAPKPLPDEISLNFASPVGVETVGVFIAGEKATDNVPAKLSAETSRYETKVNTFAEGDKLFAYAPYSADVTALDNIAFTIPAEQSLPKAGERNPELSLSVAGPETLPAPAEVVSLESPVTFSDITPYAEFSISDASGAHAAETVQSVSFISNGAALTGKLVYDVTGEAPAIKNAADGGKTVTVIPEIVSEVGTGKTAYVAVMAPGSYTGKAIVETSAARYTFDEISVEAKTGGTAAAAELDLAQANLKEIITEMGWKAFATAVDNGDYSAWKNEDGEVKLGADIEVTTYLQRVGAVKEPHDWDGVFNGQDYTITQHETIVPLFTVIAKDGVVKNMKLKGSMTEVRYPDGVGSGSIAKFNYGTLSNIESGIDIKIDASSANYMVCGMVQLNCGTMENCRQTGDIDVTYKLDETRTTYIGGLACFASNSAQSQKEQDGLALGKFINCVNTGNITAHKTGAAGVYTAKFSMGGICAIVHQGIPSNYSVFEDCSNSGNISRIDDDQNGKNNFSAVGGIIGRVADAQHDYFKLTNNDNGFYVKINRCSNTGTIENSSYLLNGWSGNNVSGARMGAAGGIVGYIRGPKDSYAEITDCIVKCVVKGGHAISSNILGGISGMSSYTKFSGCTAEVKFNDSSLTGVELLTGAVGGIVGYVRNSSDITGCSANVEINMPATRVSEYGLCTAGASTIDKEQTVNVSDSKFCGSIAHKGLEVPVTVTEENLNANLFSFGARIAADVTYWSK